MQISLYLTHRFRKSSQVRRLLRTLKMTISREALNAQSKPFNDAGDMFALEELGIHHVVSGYYKAIERAKLVRF